MYYLDFEIEKVDKMLFKKWFKKYIGNIFIIIGIIFMSFSIVSFLNLKYTSKKISNNYEQNIAKEIELPTESLDQPEYDYTYMTKNDTLSRIEKNIQINTKNDIKTNSNNYIKGIMLIDIPKLDVKATVIDGTTSKHLKQGPGLYEDSPLPYEEGGNVCIAGHRTTYGAWFRHIDKLVKGDNITLDFEGSKYTYNVEEVFIVEKDDWSITKSQGYSALTLSSCHPLWSSKERIIVRAKLVN